MTATAATQRTASTRDVWLVDAAGVRRAATLAGRIGSTGSQGAVWELHGLPDVVAKIMHRTDSVHLAVRLDAMLARGSQWARRGGHLSVAWPVATVRRRGDLRLIGYLAPKLAAPGYAQLPLLMSPSLRARMLPDISWLWWLRLAEELARTVHAAHQQGHVLGDLAPANIFATPDAGVCLIDADGWQIHEPRTGTDLLCPFSRPEYTAPEDLDGPPRRRTPANDCWALAVVIGQLLCLGFHPFGGVPGQGDRIVEEVDNVRARACWVLGAEVRLPPAAPPAWLLPRVLRGMLARALQRGYTDPGQRPGPLDWAAALARTQRELVPCTREPCHLYPGELPDCPWCAMVGAGARDPFPRTGPQTRRRPAGGAR